MNWKNIALLGDSIGQGFWDETGIGWFGRLAQMIGKGHPYRFGFHNASQSGDTVIDVLHRFSAEVQQRGADHLMIAVGINDLIRWGDWNAQTSLSLDTSRITWETLLTRAKASFEKVVVIGCIPVIEGAFPQAGALDLPLYHKNDDIERYNFEIETLCDRHQVAHCEIYKLLEGRDELFYDASHPNGDGHQIMAEHIFKFLGRHEWFE